MLAPDVLNPSTSRFNYANCTTALACVGTMDYVSTPFEPAMSKQPADDAHSLISHQHHDNHKY
jgi:hypothetical protein